MNGHTKGPWIVSADGCEEERTFRFLVGGPHFGPGEKAQAVDDARLIAAAPGLLEACRAALVYCQSDPAIHPLNEKLRAAIAAAEGRGA